MKNKLILGISIVFITIIVLIASISALVISDVSTSPDQIAPGETSSIDIKLENTGDNDVTEVSVNLILDPSQISAITQATVSQVTLPFAPFGSSSSYSIDKIKDGDIETAKFEVIALSDAKAGIYKIPVIVSYKEKDVTKTASSLIGLQINSEPIISAEAQDGLFLKEKENEVSIKVINKGLSGIKFLDVEIGTVAYTDITSNKRVYLGNLDSDDFDSATFKLFFKKNSATNLNLPITLYYKDSANKDYVKTFSVPIKVYSQQQAIELGLVKKSNVGTYVVVVIVLVIVFIIYRRMRKRKNNKN